MKKVRRPNNPDKIYGYLRYHEWFYEWNNIKEAFEDIIKLYMTEIWWDYDGFNLYKGNPKWKLDKDKPINWRKILTKKQCNQLKKAEEYNLNMDKDKKCRKRKLYG